MKNLSLFLIACLVMANVNAKRTPPTKSRSKAITTHGHSLVVVRNGQPKVINFTYRRVKGQVVKKFRAGNGIIHVTKTPSGEIVNRYVPNRCNAFRERESKKFCDKWSTNKQGKKACAHWRKVYASWRCEAYTHKVVLNRGRKFVRRIRRFNWRWRNLQKKRSKVQKKVQALRRARNILRKKFYAKIAKVNRVYHIRRVKEGKAYHRRRHILHRQFHHQNHKDHHAYVKRLQKSDKRFNQVNHRRHLNWMKIHHRKHSQYHKARRVYYAQWKKKWDSLNHKFHVTERKKHHAYHTDRHRRWKQFRAAVKKYHHQHGYRWRKNDRKYHSKNGDIHHKYHKNVRSHWNKHRSRAGDNHRKFHLWYHATRDTYRTKDAEFRQKWKQDWKKLHDQMRKKFFSQKGATHEAWHFFVTQEHRKFHDQVLVKGIRDIWHKFHTLVHKKRVELKIKNKSSHKKFNVKKSAHHKALQRSKKLNVKQLRKIRRQSKATLRKAVQKIRTKFYKTRAIFTKKYLAAKKQRRIQFNRARARLQSALHKKNRLLEDQFHKGYQGAHLKTHYDSWKLVAKNYRRKEKISLGRRHIWFRLITKLDKNNAVNEDRHLKRIYSWMWSQYKQTNSIRHTYYKAYRKLSLTIRSGYRYLRHTKNSQKKWIVRNIYKTVWRKRVHRKCTKKTKLFRRSTGRFYCASRGQRYRRNVCVKRNKKAKCIRRINVFGFKLRTRFRVAGKRVVTSKVSMIYPELRCVKQSKAKGKKFCLKEQVVRPVIYRKKYAIVANRKRVIEQGVFYGKNPSFTCAKKSSLLRMKNKVNVCVEFVAQSAE